jgi:hypothetical protein
LAKSNHKAHLHLQTIATQAYVLNHSLLITQEINLQHESYNNLAIILNQSSGYQPELQLVSFFIFRPDEEYAPKVKSHPWQSNVAFV